MRLWREFTARLRHFHDPLRCRDAVELVTDYLEGAMPAGERERFERHMHACPECTRYLEQARLTTDVLGHVHPPPPSDETRAALLRALQQGDLQ
jgi:anti-sigma factor RsiW